jgi:DNA/RNA-binding domain of Phe-tRNA-synthetase-like protein
MISIQATPEWTRCFPEGLIGILELNVRSKISPALEEHKRALETELRDRYSGYSRAQLAAAPVMRDYVRYYKSFGKTYHILLQLASIVLKAKPFPTVSPLVDANFVAELDSLVLTAGHDADKLHHPVYIDVSTVGDVITHMSGAAKAVPSGDMIMRDTSGICCAILHGQDNRSPISESTQHVLYVAYGVLGVSEAHVRGHFDRVLTCLRLASDELNVEQNRIIAP